MKTTHFTLLSLLIAATCAFSQVATERTCRIIFPDRPAEIPQTLHLFDGVSSQEVELPVMNLSPIYKLPSGALTLRLLPAMVADPNTVSPDAPSVVISETHTDFYLLISSDPGNKIVPVSMSLIDANSTLLGPGQMLWINLTEKTITGNLGSVNMTLKPHLKEVVKEPYSGVGNYSVDLNFLIEDNDIVHPLCKTQWNHNPSSRTLVIVMPDKKRRTPRILAFTDFRQHEEPKEKESKEKESKEKESKEKE